MAPYLLQWAMIQYAKSTGATTYDFTGISPQGSFKHEYDGITQFKLKFGGARQTYYPGSEIPLDKNAYRFYKAAKWLQRLKRRFL